MSSTDTNQASEDELIYGVDIGIPGGDSTALSIKKGSTLFTFTGDEAVAIVELIRTEKLKLLAEVRERVVGEDDYQPGNPAPDLVEHNQLVRDGLRFEQRAALNKLEVEL